MKRLALVLAFVAAPAWAQMYKCVDERGVTRYTDAPGPGCKEVAIRASPPISGSLSPPADDLARQEAEFRKRQLDRDASVMKEREALLQRCAQLRREQTVLTTSRRVLRVDEKGEREYMDDGVREQRIADIQRELARCP